MSSDDFRFIECFHTFQGEGPDTGKSVLLVRFKLCNRACSWCDTREKLTTLPETPFSLWDLQEKLDYPFSKGLLITGGEPTFDSNLQDTLNMLSYLHADFFNIETNGLGLDELVLQMRDAARERTTIIYSPKFFTDKDYIEALERLKLFSGHYHSHPNLYIKLVLDTSSDLLLEFIKKLKALNLNRCVFLMPKAQSMEELIENSPSTLEVARKYGFHFSSRLHIIHNFV